MNTKGFSLSVRYIQSMKKLIPLLALTMTGCGTDVYFTCMDGFEKIDGYCQKPQPAPSPVPSPTIIPEPSIINKWAEIAPSAVISSPDFSNLVLNTTGDGNAVMGCTGSYGNNISVNTLTSGQMRLQGGTTEGILQFGNVKYFGMDYTTINGRNCKNVSKEMYSYTIRNQVLKLCLTNLAYPYCSTYNLAP